MVVGFLEGSMPDGEELDLDGLILGSEDEMSLDSTDGAALGTPVGEELRKRKYTFRQRHRGTKKDVQT